MIKQIEPYMMNPATLIGVALLAAIFLGLVIAYIAVDFKNPKPGAPPWPITLIAVAILAFICFLVASTAKADPDLYAGDARTAGRVGRATGAFVNNNSTQIMQSLSAVQNSSTGSANTSQDLKNVADMFNGALSDAEAYNRGFDAGIAARCDVICAGPLNGQSGYVGQSGYMYLKYDF